MQVIADSDIPFLSPQPCALTIGSFDGLHLGHLSLLNHARSLLPKNGRLIIYTFINHPTHVLSHIPPIPFIYTLEHKLKILQENRVDYVILSTFTKELAQIPFDQFLQKLKKTLQFTHLVLGVGASFGKDRQGNESNVKQLASSLDFQPVYVPKLHLNDETLSSGRIRALIAEAAFSHVARYLGRPYSIYAPLLFKHEHYMQLNQHCLPPTGTYPIHIALEDKTYEGTAHIDRPAQRIRIHAKNAPPLPHTALAEVFF